MDPAALDRIEEGGRLDVGPYGGASRLRKELPWLSWEAARMRFGTIGPSNHFVELQQVEEISMRRLPHASESPRASSPCSTTPAEAS